MNSVLQRIDSDARTDASPSAPGLAEDSLQLVEALLFSGGTTVTVQQLAQLTGLDEDQIIQTIAQLNQQYFRQGRPYEIRRSQATYQMLLRPSFAAVVRRLRGRSHEVRLSVAAIEVLSLVAYKQPVTLQSIDAIRGVDSGPIVRQLLRRNLIEPAEPPTASSGVRSAVFRTTKRFLQLFHLNTLEDLPRVQDLEKA
jgi:segregation and condensation protein B